MNPIIGRYSLLATALCGLALTACNAVDNSGNKGNFAPAPTPNVVLRGTVTGLGGNALVLQNNGANDRSFTNPIATSSNTSSISFGTVMKGSAYSVTGKMQPYGRICTIETATASGVANADVTNLAVNCVRDQTVPTYTVGATVSNVVTGTTGLQLKLHTADGDEFASVAGNGAVTFATMVLPNSSYSVSLWGRPTVNNTMHDCSVTNGSGTIPLSGGANVTNVAVSCSFAVGGTVAFPLVFGPAPTIASPGVGLSLSAGGPAVATANVTATPFQFPGRQLSTVSAFYTVSITSQPPGQTCVLRSGGGAVGVTLTTPGDVTSIALSCTSAPAGGTALTGTYRSSTGRDVLTFFANGTFLYGTHPGLGTSGVEQGLYGAGFNGANSRFLTITTDTNGAGGLSNSSADGGFVSLVNIAKTASDITFARAYGFPTITTPAATYAVAGATAGQLRGAWVTADAFRVFVYDNSSGTGYHMGVNGSPNLQDVCLAVTNPTATTGTYTQNRSSSCTVAGGVVDTDPTAAFGGFFGLPGAPSGGANPPINYAVTAGSPDTMILQPGAAPISWSRSSPN